MAITRPMLAATLNDEVINFPVLGTPKIDGIRALYTTFKFGNEMHSNILNICTCVQL